MNTLKCLAMTSALVIAGCATSGPASVAESTPGRFITYTCEGKKTFSVRYDAELGTARIRTHEGSAELSKGDRGLYRDEAGEWVLTLAAGNGTELVHKGKAAYKNCSAG